MNFLDYTVLTTLIISTAFGATRGILKGLLSLGSTLLGLFAAVYGYAYVAYAFKPFVETERAADLLGFIAIFLLFVIGGSFLSYNLRRAIRRARLNCLDTALGATFGFLRGWLFCSVLYLALTAFPIQLEMVHKAGLAPLLLEGTQVISYVTSKEFRERFLESYQIVTRIWEERSKKS